MIRKLDDADCVAIGQFIDAGAHLVPYNNNKMPPDFFCWGGESYDANDPAFSRIRNVDEAIAYNMDVPKEMQQGKWLPDGFGIGLHVNTAGCVVVDIDCLMPMDDAEYRQSGMNLTQFQQKKKAEWKSQPGAVIDAVLNGLAADVAAKCPAHAVMRSGSGKGLHFYYRCLDAGNYHRDHACIEIFAKKGRLAYVTEWKKLDGFFDAVATPLADVLAYWEAKGNALYKVDPLKDALMVRLTAPVSTGRVDYEALMRKSSYAQSGRNNRLYVKLCTALRAGDSSGWDDAISEARLNRLSDSEINIVIRKAQRTTGISSV